MDRLDTIASAFDAGQRCAAPSDDMSSSTSNLLASDSKPILSLVTADTRRSLSIFSRKGSMREPSGLLSTMMFQSSEGRRPVTSRPAPARSQLLLSQTHHQRALERLVSTPHKALNDPDLLATVAAGASTPLSAAALESSALRATPVAIRAGSQTRVSEWVDVVATSDTTYHMKLPAVALSSAHPRTPSRQSDSYVTPSKERIGGHIAEQMQLAKSISITAASEPRAKVISVNSTRTALQSHPLSSSSNGSTELSARTSSSDYDKLSSQTSVESLPAVTCVVSPCATISEHQAPTDFAPSLCEASRPEVLSSVGNSRIRAYRQTMKDKPLPLLPRTPSSSRLEYQRSYSSLPDTTTQSPGFLVRVNSDESIYQRPSSAQSLRTRAIRTSKSRYDFDQLDLEFQSSNPQLPIPTGRPIIVQPSPTVIRAIAQEREEGFRVSPLHIHRRITHTISEDEVTALPEITVSRTLIASPVSPSPILPRRSSRRGGSFAARRFLADERASRQSLLMNTVVTETVESHISVAQQSTALLPPIANLLAIPTSSHMDVSALSPISSSARLSILVPSADDQDLHQTRNSGGPYVQHTAAAAEQALLCIMMSVQTIDDLKSLASIDRGARRIYKKNELAILKMVLRTQCLPAWELREWLAPMVSPSMMSTDAEDSSYRYDAQTYKRHFAYNKSVVDRLKVIILERCSSFMRHETVSALSSSSAGASARIEDALYRIWCFCAIFSPEKQREEDVTGQMDWFRGGVLAHQQDCTATITDHSQFDFSSVLLMPPEYFGKCNKGGLSADELYDMTEIWNCLTALLRDYAEAIEEARAYGVLSEAQDEDDSESGRNHALQTLESWIFHVLAMGPEVILDLAEAPDLEAGFALAQKKGWTRWNPANVHLATFMRDPLCRLYQEQVAANPLTAGLGAAERTRRQQARERVRNLSQDLLAARRLSYYQRRSYVNQRLSFSQERPMSTLTRSASICSDATLVDANSTGMLSKNASPISTQLPSWHQPRSRGGLPFRSTSPLMEDVSEEWDLHEVHGFATDMNAASCNPSRHLLNEVVLAGFPVPQAREALRVTWDAYRGFQPDAAVNWLVEQTHASD